MALRGSAFFTVLLVFLSATELNGSSSPYSHPSPHFRVYFPLPLLPDTTKGSRSSTRTSSAAIAPLTIFPWYHDQLSRATALSRNLESPVNATTEILPTPVIAGIPVSMDSTVMTKRGSVNATISISDSSISVKRESAYPSIPVTAAHQLLCTLIVCLGFGFAINQRLLQKSTTTATIDPIHAEDDHCDATSSVQRKCWELVVYQPFLIVERVIIPMERPATFFAPTFRREPQPPRAIPFPQLVFLKFDEPIRPTDKWAVVLYQPLRIVIAAPHAPAWHISSVFIRAMDNIIARAAIDRTKGLTTVPFSNDDGTMELDTAAANARPGCWDLILYIPLVLPIQATFTSQTESNKPVSSIRALLACAFVPRLYAIPRSYLAGAFGGCGKDLLAVVRYSPLMAMVHVREVEGDEVDESGGVAEAVLKSGEHADGTRGVDGDKYVKERDAPKAAVTISVQVFATNNDAQTPTNKLIAIAGSEASSIDSETCAKAEEVVAIVKRKVLGLVDLNLPMPMKAEECVVKVDAHESRVSVEAPLEKVTETHPSLGVKQARLSSNQCKRAFVIAELAIACVRLGWDIPAPSSLGESWTSLLQEEDIQLEEAANDKEADGKKRDRAAVKGDKVRSGGESPRFVGGKQENQENQETVAYEPVRNRLTLQYRAASTVAAASAKFNCARSVHKNTGLQGSRTSISYLSNMRMVQVDASNNHACTKVEDATPRRLDGAQRGDVEVVKEWVPASTQTTRKSDLDLWTSWNPSLTTKNLFSVRHLLGSLVDPHILEALGNDQNTKVPIVQNNKKESTKNQTGADHEAPAHEAVSIAETEGIEYAGVASVESNAARADDAELTTGNNDDANDVFINAPEVEEITSSTIGDGESVDGVKTRGGDAEGDIHVLRVAASVGLPLQPEMREIFAVRRDVLETGSGSSLFHAVHQATDPEDITEFPWSIQDDASLALNCGDVSMSSDDSVGAVFQGTRRASLGNSTLLMLAKDPELAVIFEDRFKNQAVLPELPHRPVSFFAFSSSTRSGSRESSYLMEFEHAEGDKRDPIFTGDGCVSGCNIFDIPGELKDMDMKDAIFTFDSRALESDAQTDNGCLQAVRATVPIWNDAYDAVDSESSDSDVDVVMEPVKRKVPFLGINKARLEARKNSYYKSKYRKNQCFRTSSAKSSFASSYTRGTRPPYKKARLVPGEMEDTDMVDVGVIGRMKQLRAEQALDRRIQRLRSPVTYTGDMIHAMQCLHL